MSMTNMTKIIRTVSEWREVSKDRDLGVVMTMGALHEGHLSLVKRAKESHQEVVVTIFVNPTQFNDQNDYVNYPVTLEKDIALLQEYNVDYIFTPSDKNELYPDHYNYKMTENSLSRKLCGEYRPGHFDGVLTIVLKLLNLINARAAYFGEKDYQQYLLIKGMCEASFHPTTIVPVPIVRESDGLAMSSRNVRLTPQERKVAPAIYKAMTTLKTTNDVRDALTCKGFKVDYVEDLDERRFVAATLGNVRLIDNVTLK